MSQCQIVGTITNSAIKAATKRAVKAQKRASFKADLVEARAWMKENNEDDLKSSLGDAFRAANILDA